MSRTTVYTALVLRNRSSGESNSEVTLLTAEEGIIKATVFGGAKSKLRAYCSPYNSGQVWIYRDKAKDYAKLSDFDVQFWRPGLRELYDRTMAAGAAAQTILSSHGGGGEWASALKLALETLNALEDANEELCLRLLVHFLWRWAHLLGIKPHLDCCAACDEEADNAPLWFNIHDNTALCDGCAGIQDPRNSADYVNYADSRGLKKREHDKFIKLNPGCRKWLIAVEALEAAQVSRYSMDNNSFAQAKALASAVLTAAIGKRLTSWDW